MGRMSKYTRCASTDEQEQSIQQVEEWLTRLQKNIRGGTTIGKSPQTVILDLTYQGSEIYIDSDGKIEIFNIEVHDFNEFKEQYDKVDFRKVR